MFMGRGIIMNWWVESDRVLKKKLFINHRGGILKFYWCEVLNRRFRFKVGIWSSVYNGGG